MRADFGFSHQEPGGGADRSGLVASTAQIRGEPKGLFRLLEPLMARSAKTSIEADYDRLVDLLEEKVSE